MDSRSDRPFERYVRAAAEERRRALAGALRRARRTPSPEAVHDVRVAIRRLLTVFAVCPSRFEAKAVRQARKRLKRVLGAAGRVRDRDIALALLDAPEETAPTVEESAEAAAIRERLIAEREGAARVFRRKVRKSRRHDLRRRLRRAIESRSRGGSGGANDGWLPAASAAENARRRLPELAADLFALGRETISPDAALADLHRFRLAIKRLRYTFELFRACYADRLEGPIAALRELQDRLGAINDLGVAGQYANSVQDGCAADGEAEIASLDRDWRETFDAPGEREGWMLELARTLPGATDRRPAA